MWRTLIIFYFVIYVLCCEEFFLFQLFYMFVLFVQETISKMKYFRLIKTTCGEHRDNHGHKKKYFDYLLKWLILLFEGVSMSSVICCGWFGVRMFFFSSKYFCKLNIRKVYGIDKIDYSKIICMIRSIWHNIFILNMYYYFV